MKIATWNVGECAGLTCNLDDQETVTTVSQDYLNEVISKINQNSFDIVCFQEYPVYIDGEEKLSHQITTQTNLKHYYAYDTYDSYLFHGGRGGVAIFSKYALQNVESTMFYNPDMTKTSSTGEVYHSFDKGIIKAEVETGGKTYTIITGHAMAFAPFDKTEFDFPESYRPLEQLINQNSTKNLIVLGDFNTESIFELMPDIRHLVKDIVKNPTTKNYYENRGEVQMDYILINKNIKVLNTYKIDNFSDHYIIGANLE